jgi:hypothetical protein
MDPGTRTWLENNAEPGWKYARTRLEVSPNLAGTDVPNPAGGHAEPGWKLSRTWLENISA